MQLAPSGALDREPDKDTTGRKVVQTADAGRTVRKSRRNRKIDNFTNPATQLLLFERTRMFQYKFLGRRGLDLQPGGINRVFGPGPADANPFTDKRIGHTEAIVVQYGPFLFVLPEDFGMLELHAAFKNHVHAVAHGELTRRLDFCQGVLGGKVQLFAQFRDGC